jgi:Transglycosylase SLT domain
VYLAGALPLLVAASIAAAAAVRQAHDVAFARAGTAAARPRPGAYFRTLAPGTTLPRADRRCRTLVTRRGWEPRPDNYAANHTMPSGRVHWPTTQSQLHWRRWIAKRRRVTGHYTGRTDEIIRWAACKWGLDENLLRAVAVKESYWHQNTVGDNGGSFGLMQIKDHYGDGTPDLGGYPWTQRSTALAVDVYAAWMRSCFDGDFYDGGRWLYGGHRVRGDIWGCVGAWYSGDWYSSGAMNYIADVKRLLAARAWRGMGS